MPHPPSLRSALATIALCAGAAAALAQPANDECAGAIELGEVSRYCSEPEQFNNLGATDSGFGDERNCHPQGGTSDVWFLFEATGSDANIRVIGQLPRLAGGTLRQPQFSLYDASCTTPTELACASDGADVGVAETFANDLEAGTLYFLRVSARDSMQGTFQLCIEMFDFIPEPQSDCVDGVVLCDKSPFTVASLQGAGNDTDEIEDGNCLFGLDPFSSGPAETGSVWYRWTCDEPGSLGFVLTPNNPVDDLDFAVYELPGGIDDCAGKRLLRCMASGEFIGAPFDDWIRCNGPTGLRDGDGDREEEAGCRRTDNNFAESIQMEAGRSYALIVNNFSNTGNGFGIEWTGTGTFLGPKPDFAFDPATGNQCDAAELITFTDRSTFPPGVTGSSEWFFGEYANPPQGFGTGPFEVGYSGFGDKVITLRVTSDAGCVVTERRELYIEPCCDGSDPLVADEPTVTDPLCPGTATGAFDVGVVSGAPDYFFSVGGGPFLADAATEGLFAGTYDVFLQNIKGCTDTVAVTLVDPPPINVEVGDDRFAELGDELRVSAVTDPPGNFSFSWSGADSIRCLDARCSEVIVIAGNAGELVVEIADDDGCTASDLLRIDVRKTRPLYAPTAFSPNGDLVNDFWTLYGPEEIVLRIRNLRVFNRWGELVFEREALPPNRPELGWDGRQRGRDLNPGVFAWAAEIVYVDGVVVPATGDLTLLRP